LSPFLFNIAADTLAKMISLAQRNKLFKGLVPEYIENGVAVLQYADDTILCIQDDIIQAANLKLLLYLYEDMSGLKINFSKSEVIMVSQDEAKSLEFSNMFNCTTGKWPIKYLGIPVAGSRLHVADWLPICEKVMKRLDGWKGSSLSLGGRLVLINSCLSNLPVYAMSMFWLHVSVIDKMDTARKRFFWQGGNMKKKYHLIKWNKITKPKNRGGLGIKDLRRMNISLLCKWWWKAENGEGIWHDIIRKKYMKKGMVGLLAKSPKNSPMWNDLLKVRHVYLKGRSMKVGNGKNTSFWHDRWCGLVSLADKFPDLYKLCVDQDCSVEYMKMKKWRLSFRRWLHEDLQCQYRRLHDIVFRYDINSVKDHAFWDWDKSGVFSVKSTYKYLSRHDYGPNYKMIWKAKLPLKIKIFMWLVSQNVILTKDNLIKRKWKGNKSCAFCKENENSRHLFFECPTAKYVWSLLAYALGSVCRPNSMAQYWYWIYNILPQTPNLYAVGLAAVIWAIWRIRNAVCFDNKRMKSPTEIVCLICSFLTYWAGLLNEGLKEQVIQGAEVIKSTALYFHKQDLQTHTQEGHQLVPFAG
jgi:hypothetical protein